MRPTVPAPHPAAPEAPVRSPLRCFLPGAPAHGAGRRRFRTGRFTPMARTCRFTPRVRPYSGTKELPLNLSRTVVVVPSAQLGVQSLLDFRTR